jgi:mannose PTS system EIIA component
MAPFADKDALVGLVVVTHGVSGEDLLAAATGLVGPITASASVSVNLADPFDEIVRHVRDACDHVDTGAGVVILVDVHGSSPFRACLAMLDGTRSVEIVCGVNLPMLIKLATVDRRGAPACAVAEVVQEVGKRSIRLGSELVGKAILPRAERH